jgi:putative membrane protein
MDKGELIMKKIFYFGAMLLLTIFVSVSFGQDTMKSDGKTQTSNSKNSDSKFMMMAATSGMNEISLSNQALSKSSNDDVKKLAQMMIDDHTKANDELKSLAATKNVTLPTEADSKHKSAMEKMSSISGEAFDKAYVKMMVSDHEKAVSMFQKESTNGKDAEAKAFAASKLPALQSHLEMARGTMSKLNGNKMADNKMKSGM